MATDTRLKEALPELTERIVSTYTDISKINHLGHSSLPSTEAVVEIIEDLKEVLYPGYGRRQNLHMGNVAYHVGDILDGLLDKLTDQFTRALRHEASEQELVEEDFEVIGQQRAVQFLERLPHVRAMLADDVQAAYDGDPAAKSLHEIIFCYPGVEAVTIYRTAHELYLLDVPLIPRMMTEYAHSKTGVDIHPGARIGRSFFIDHATGVVIGETTDIGDRVKLYQGVTLGALSFPKDANGNIIRGMKRHPTIEDDVVVYANATILGGKTVIGHRAVVGSNVWLTDSVAPHTVVAMEKPSLRFKESASSQKLEFVPDYAI
jgi:serine O-acetyltransferase